VAMVVGGLLISAPTPAGAQALSDQTFSGYSSGTAVSVNALQLGTTQVANVQQATASAVVNSKGLNPPPSTNEMGQTVLPTNEGAKNSYARGAGLEVGALTNVPDPNNQNQLILSGLAQADAPPPTGPVVKTIGPVNLDPIVRASVLTGTAQATYDPNFCAVGVPFSFGRGEAAGAQVLTTAGPPPTGLVDTTQAGKNVSQSRSFTYLVSNGDGTFGMATETHMTVAPITIGAVAGLPAPVTLEVLGEFVLRTVATGKQNGASVTFAPAGSPSPTDPIVRLNGTTVLTTQQLLGGGGLSIPVAPLLTLQIGVPPHPIGATSGPAPAATDGTSASGAVDLVRLTVLSVPGLTGGDIRVAHAEGAAVAPAGGIKCNIPVSKTADPDPVTVGNDVTIHINIPSDVAQYSSLFGCDLVGIKVIDTEAVASGNPSFTIVSADNGATVSGNTVTFGNAGNYHPGDPARVLNVVLHIPSNSGAGVLKDTAQVSAVLGNCTGGAAGQDLVGAANLQNNAITGTGVLIGPNVSRGNLAATGGNTWPLVAGGGFLLAALGLVRLRRRATDGTTEPTTT
jgi:hypothetical protein